MIIDSHAHLWRRKMLPDSILKAYLEPLLVLDGIIDFSRDREDAWPITEVFAKGLVEAMDGAGVDKAVILPLDFGLVGEPEIGIEEYNQWVFESSEEYKDRLIPFVGVDPNRGKRAIELVQRFVKDYDAKGIKVYPATGFRPNEERLAAFWKLLDDYGMVVLSHSGASWGPLDEECNHPMFYKEVLERFPSLKVVIAHLGGKWRLETYELARTHDNIYADCSAVQGWLPSEPEVAIDRLKEAALHMRDRLVFGADWPLFDLSYSYLSWTDFVKGEDWASEEVKEKMLGGTMRKVLGL
ncbi:MAG: amidohydrolase family protein [Methanomassiliicoccales archaeon]|nr:amidohydrolase family protein [Methanomassiliicoccales archaeon]